ncbi:RRP15-like protein isoform X2 [Brachypodium distachyon]|uniref:RRP15-like protein n=1 Tax=Brachypodium distachyon TaxID=15368 RepID=A0A0Q3QT72_BRADI|nr:RRP15-like protein isoform X2 [Brachypodium distachyon]KQK04698.1 hypothetical protein BRADI_2g15350v3 [Brachypodium distachyon]|eukprot:XP_010230986.1 RRP15-like protein isoform X2 [Brachypodium distachyon]
MAATVAAPPPAAMAAAPGNPHKRKKQPKGKGRGNTGKNKKLKGPDDAVRRRRKPSSKFIKLLEKRARDYNSDDDEEVDHPPPRRQHAEGGDAAVDGDDNDDQEAPSSEEEASSSGDESGEEEKAAVTRFEQGCRAFRVAFTKIMSKKLPDDPLGPILSAHKKLVAAKLAEEADEHKSKGEARKEKRIAAEKGHVIPENHINNKEKMLIKVATQGVVRLFNEVSKRQTRKGLNPSRTKALGREKTLSVPSNQGQKGQASSSFSKHIGKDEDEPGWAPLRDTYMLGSKLKDWDKVQDSDVAKQTEVPLDNFSDDE